MKKKKALLVLMMAAVIVAVGGLTTLVLQYFSQSSTESIAGGDLSIDYYVSEKEEIETTETQQSSKNVFQWLMDKLAADKENADAVIFTDPDAGEQTSSGVTQNRKETVEEDVAEETDKPMEVMESATENEKREKTKEIADEKEVEDTSKDTQPEDTATQEQDNPNSKQGATVTLTIRCDTAVAKGMNTESKWAGIVPSSGVILPVTEFEIDSGETVFSVMSRASSQYKFQMEYSGTNGAQYIEGINNLYEFDGGRWSGWMYCVNGWYPNYGCGQYALKDGDVIEWHYTCDLGKDLGQEWLGEDWTETHE